MNVVETTSTSWFSRIGGAITGAIVGVIIVIVAIVALFWNENRSISTYRSLVEGLSIYVKADATQLDPSLEGKLIHISSPVTTDAPATDPDTGISADGAIGLSRKVEMFQWVETESSKTEKKLGGGEETVTTYSYAQEWSSVANPSSGFKEPQGHTNPDMWINGAESYLPLVQLGAYQMPAEKVAAVGTRQELPMDQDQADSLSAALGYPGEGMAEGRAIYFAASTGAPVNPKAPVVGDTRITYETVTLPEVSLVGMQQGDTLTEFATSNGYTVFLLAAGTESAEKMFADEQASNVLITWLIRFGGIFGLFIGFASILRIFSVIGDVVPFIGSIIGFGTGLISFLLALGLGTVVIAIGWFAVRPLLSLGLIAAAAVIVYGITRLRRKKVAVAA